MDGYKLQLNVQCVGMNRKLDEMIEFYIILRVFCKEFMIIFIRCWICRLCLGLVWIFKNVFIVGRG